MKSEVVVWVLKGLFTGLFWSYSKGWVMPNGISEVLALSCGDSEDEALKQLKILKDKFPEIDIVVSTITIEAKIIF